jgi:exo-beta-1,3-glucanase (GH17 family)
LHLYKKGTEVGVPPDIASVDSVSNADNLILSRSGYPVDGIMDEVRVSSVARSADWIKTEYNNMFDPGDIGTPGFYTVGAEEVL